MRESGDQLQLPNDGKVYYTIGEVAELLGENVSLIRFWEKHFKAIRPKRNNKGHRIFTRDQLIRLKSIHHLVKVKGMTLQGAAEALSTEGEMIDKETALRERLLGIRDFLKELRSQL